LIRVAEASWVHAPRPDPGQRRRARLVRRRRRLAIAGVVALVGVGAAALAASGGGGGGSAGGTASDRTAGAEGQGFRTKLVVRTVASLPAAISGEAVAASGNRVLIAGGLDASSQSVDGVFMLDPATGRLQSSGHLDQPLHDAAAAPLGGSTLVIGGGNAASTSAVERLHAGGAGVIAHLPTPRSDLAAASAAGRVWAIGGYDGQVLAQDVLATRDGRSFSTAARLPVPVRYPAVATLANTIYLFGGETSAGSSTDAIQSIDAATGRARVIGRLRQALDHASAVAIGGRVYVLGGSVGSGATDAVLSFDPARGAVAPAGHLPTPITNAAAAVVGGSGYLVGGIGSNGAALRSVIAISRKRVPVSPTRPPTAPSAKPS
jgi:N-acetylneuraminic acid mutarotase